MKPLNISSPKIAFPLHAAFALLGALALWACGSDARQARMEGRWMLVEVNARQTDSTGAEVPLPELYLQLSRPLIGKLSYHFGADGSLKKRSPLDSLDATWKLNGTRLEIVDAQGNDPEAKETGLVREVELATADSLVLHYKSPTVTGGSLSTRYFFVRE